MYKLRARRRKRIIVSFIHASRTVPKLDGFRRDAAGGHGAGRGGGLAENNSAPGDDDIIKTISSPRASGRRR